MNIFKILANGDGTINEANISAFLGYLLDPYQDHGLGYEFLKRFLSSLTDDIVDFKSESLDYEILLESAFKKEKNSIVDITILGFKTKNIDKKQTLALELMKNERELKYIFLIENKIKTSSVTDGQLQKQYEATLNEIDNYGIKIENNNIFSIYLTPFDSVDSSKLKKEYESLKNSNKIHLFWSKNENSVYNIIKEIIKDESNAEIEAINEYTKHSLISFVQFIDSEFKSEKQIKADNLEGKFQKDYSHSVEEHLSKYKNQLNEKSNQYLLNVSEFLNEKFPNFYYRHTKTHPISILSNPNSGKVFGLTRYGKNLKLHFITRNFTDKSISLNLKKLLIENNLEVDDRDKIYDVYQEVEINKLKNILESYFNLIANATANN